MTHHRDACDECGALALTLAPTLTLTLTLTPTLARTNTKAHRYACDECGVVRYCCAAHRDEARPCHARRCGAPLPTPASQVLNTFSEP